MAMHSLPTFELKVINAKAAFNIKFRKWQFFSAVPQFTGIRGNADFRANDSAMEPITVLSCGFVDCGGT